MEDLVIVGTGPAGVSAILTARSLNLEFTVIEAAPKAGGRLGLISSITNFAGYSGAGSELASIFQEQIKGIQVRRQAITRISRHPEGFGFLLEAAAFELSARHLIWAAGLRQRSILDRLGSEYQIQEEIHLIAPNFSRIENAPSVLIVGADRPIGTLLRTAPTIASQITVLAFPGEEYKVDEFRNSFPINTLACDAITSFTTDGLGVVLGTGEERTFSNSEYLVVTNLGSIPNNEPTATIIALDEHGYPRGAATPGFMIGGDAAKRSHQRISTAIGDGARCVLDYYYERENAYR